MNKLSEVVKYFVKQYKIQLENNKTNKKLKKYYVEGKTDSRSNMAKILDYVGMRIILFFMFIIIFLIIIKNLYGSLVLSLLCTSIFHMINIFNRNRKTNKMVNNRRKYLASQKIYKEIMNKNMTEFNDFIHEVLIKSGFSNHESEFLTNQNILLKSTYNNVKVTILWKRYNNDQNVQLKEIQNFHLQLEKMNNTRGIVITTADFTTECYEYVSLKTHGIHITLIEKDKFLKIIDKAGMFPTDKEMDEYMVDRLKRQQNKLVEYKQVFLGKNKVKRYLTLSLFLLVWSKFTSYPSYYLVVSLFLLGLAMVTIYSNIKNKVGKEKDFNLDELIQG